MGAISSYAKLVLVLPRQETDLWAAAGPPLRARTLMPVKAATPEAKVFRRRGGSRGPLGPLPLV